jgi:hypothetical protein
MKVVGVFVRFSCAASCRRNFFFAASLKILFSGNGTDGMFFIERMPNFWRAQFLMGHLTFG